MQFNRKQYAQFIDETKQFLNLESQLIKKRILISATLLAGLFYLCIRFWSPEGLQKSWATGFILTGMVVLISLNLLSFLWTRRVSRKWIESETKFDYDELTGSLNRKCFEEFLDDEMRRASRYHYPLTLCRLEIDDFDSFKEHFGEARAHELLQNFARLMQGTIRDTDCLARYENEEFCVLLPHTDLVRSEKFVSRVLEITSSQVDCSFSAGLTPFRVGENKVPFLLRARTALMHAKKEGRKRICCLIGQNDNQALVQF